MARRVTPLTWRRTALLGAMIVAFALLFPPSAVRRFYALALPDLAPWTMLLICAAGAGLVAVIWFIRPGRRRP